MKVWITKYALTSGIIETEAEECGDDMVRVHNVITLYVARSTSALCIQKNKIFLGMETEWHVNFFIKIRRKVK